MSTIRSLRSSRSAPSATWPASDTESDGSALVAGPTATPTSTLGQCGGVTAEHRDTDEFRGAWFIGCDLTGATFRSCDLRQLRIVDSLLVDVDISGDVGNFVVNGVDVTAVVAAELERRQPERAQLRAMKTADDYRATWEMVERLWSETVARAGRLPEPARYESVDDEWSLVETLRHLVFVTDAWASRTVLDDPTPFHHFGYTHAGYPAAGAAAIGIDLEARPTFDEVMAVRADRQAVVRRIVDGLTDEELARQCTRPPAPGYPEEPRTVAECLRVLMDEECEHRRYAERDLSVIEGRT